MRVHSSIIAVAAAVQASQALTPRQNSDEPCAVLGSLEGGDVPAELAYDCLRSVPVDKDTDLQLIDEYKVFAEWQSTLAYLKDPPDGYNEAPVDVMARLDEIRSNVESDSYDNEFDVQNDIWKLVRSAHDGHFNYGADILSVFFFQRPLPLFSLSTDGVDVPKVYSTRVDNSQGSISLGPEISEINGQPVVDFLNDAAVWGSEMDADARYNGLFPSLAVGGRDFGSFVSSEQFPGPFTNLTYADGSEPESFENTAAYQGSFSWSDITDGASFFQACCSGPSSFSKRTVPKKPIIHIKSPVHVEHKRQNGGSNAIYVSEETAMSGYYLDGNSDVAVLSIPSFSQPASATSSGNDFPFLFQRELLDFITAVKADGKSKIIIDLRGNGGGDGVLGWDAFKAFFPTTEPADVTRFRANENFRLIGEGVKAVLGNDRLADEFPQSYASMQDMRDWNWQVQLKPDGSPYTSADELYGPVEFHGDQFTDLIRRDLSNPLSYGVPDFQIVGYGSLSNITEQPFQAGDIVMLHNGICHSTCSAFAEFMKNAGRVRSIVVGGRPANGPMQAVAGTKGGFTFQQESIRAFAQITLEALSDMLPDEFDRLRATSLGDLATTVGQTLDQRQVTAQFNCEDNIQQSDDDRIPLQFIYEAADCRIFYTENSLTDQMDVYNRAAEATWNFGKCVPDSTNHPSSLSGGDDYNPYGDFENNGEPDGNGNGNGGDGEGAAVTWGASRNLLVAVLCLALGVNML